MQIELQESLVARKSGLRRWALASITQKIWEPPSEPHPQTRSSRATPTHAARFLTRAVALGQGRADSGMNLPAGCQPGGSLPHLPLRRPTRFRDSGSGAHTSSAAYALACLFWAAVGAPLNGPAFLTKGAFRLAEGIRSSG